MSKDKKTNEVSKRPLIKEEDFADYGLFMAAKKAAEEKKRLFEENKKLAEEARAAAKAEAEAKKKDKK